MEATKKELNGFLKFKEKLIEQLKKIGGILSCFTEITFINTSLNVQTMLEQNYISNNSK
jgi:hypothetical protein